MDEVSIRHVFEFTDRTFIENLHVLPNGKILLSIFRDTDGGDLLIIDPDAPVPAVKKVVTLTGSTGQTGIAPLGEGLYAVTGGLHLPFRFELGSMSLYVVSVDAETGTGTVVDTIPVPDTKMLNGMAAIPESPHIVLSADSIGGRIWRINTQTRKVDVAVADEALGPDHESSVPLGANGLRIMRDYLYFTNSARGTFARFKIDGIGNKTGPIEIIVENPKDLTSEANAFDDFIIDDKGDAYVTLHAWAVNKITPDGSQTTFVGGPNTTTIKHPTSVVLANDGKSIYVSTGGMTIEGRAYGGQLLQVKL